MTILIFVIFYYLLLGIAYLLYFKLGLYDIGYTLGLIAHILGWAAAIYAVIDIFKSIIKGLTIKPEVIPLLPAPFLAYFLMKKMTVGVIAEAMGAKGIFPAIIRLGSILLGYGEPLQVLGMWFGILSMIFGGYVALLAAAQYKGEFIDRLYMFLGATGVVLGFVTAHLAQTGYMYPFTIMMGTIYISFYIPLYYIGLILGIFLLPLYIKYIFFR